MVRFTIRELVLVTLVVALAVGWWRHDRSLRHELRNQQSELYALRGKLMELRFSFDPEPPESPTP